MLVVGRFGRRMLRNAADIGHSVALEAILRQPPVTSIVGEQSARCTASAIPTSTWRDPSKGSLPCAVRRLSTSIRSPACQGSRALLASYASLIESTTSAPIGSPLPKRVLNGSPYSP